MKRRIIKKLAKRYIETGHLPARHVLAVTEAPDASGYVKTVLVLRSEKLRQAVRSEAYRRGWDGCHWTDPLVVSVEIAGA